MKRFIKLILLGILLSPAAFLQADPVVPLETAGSFAVLGASTVTNTGPSVLSGNVGVSPGTAITGFPPGMVTNGAIHSKDATAIQGQADALTAYNYLSGLTPTENLTGQNLGSRTLIPGVYSFSSSAQLTGLLTLNFEGLNNADVIFQIGTTLTTASASMVDLTNLGTNDNVFFQVGSSATLGTTTDFEGTIIADQSITLNTGATIGCGSAIALNGAVTLDTNTIGSCPNGDSGPGTLPSSVPEPASFGLLLTGVLGLGGVVRKRFMA